MPKRQKKKVQVNEEDPEVEVITKVEFIYEYTKATTGVEQEYKWGEVYRMISSQVSLMLVLKTCTYIQILRGQP